MILLETSGGIILRVYPSVILEKLLMRILRIWNHSMTILLLRNMNENNYFGHCFFCIHVKGKITKRMGICDYCHTENEYLFDIFKPDYSSILFRVCHLCNVRVFLCPFCLNLRDREEEYVNGY